MALSAPVNRLVGPNNFDAIRLLMAIIVIFAHANPLSQRGLIDPLARWTHGATGMGTLAVDVFFAISGYLITMSRERAKSSIMFATRRVLRIYPGFIVAAATSLLVFAPLGWDDFLGYPWPSALWNTIANSLTLNEIVVRQTFTQNAYPAVVNGSLWTIKIEFACYLLALLIAGGRWQRWLVPAVAAIALGAHALVTFGVLRAANFRVGFVIIQPTESIRFIAIFAVAALLWIGRDRVRFRVPIAAGLVIAAATLTQVGATALATSFLPIVVPYVVLTLAFLPMPFTQNFASRVGGDYSYGVYLYAFPIQQLVARAFGGEMSPLLNFTIVTPIALLFGVASWHLVEKHFVRRDRGEARATVVPAT